MRLRILVVEDHASFRNLICTALQRPEFQIVEAGDGAEAVQQAKERQPHLVLLDINLPKLNGFEVATRIRRLVPHARLLFMSQESSPDFVRKAFSVGANGYIHKPRAGTDLLPAIDAVLSWPAIRQQQCCAFAEPADPPAPRRHEILFCPDDAASIEGFARFIGAALNAGDGALALVTESHRPRLLQRLRAQGVDIDGAIARGTYRSFDADEAPDPDRFLEAVTGVRQAAARSGTADPRVAFCGDRAGRLWAAGRTAEAAQLEQFCNELAQDVDILCIYPVPYTKDDQALACICAEHTATATG